MDIFVEQIVAIKKSGKTYLAYLGIALAALFFLFVTFIFLTTIFIPIIALIVFGVYKLCARLNIEYEYIITNTTMDIDKIIAKSSRKRVLSFEISSIQRIEKFNGTLPANVDNDCFFACNKDDKDAFFVFYKEDGKPQKTFIFSPNEHVREAIKSIVPRYVSENF